MMKFLNAFRKEEDGAVTVDWVVLTAALVVLGLLVLQAVGGGAEDLANDLGADMTAMVTP